MKALVGFFVMAFLLAMPFQINAQKMTGEEVAQITAEVTQFLEGWMTAWEKNDCGILNDFAHPELTAYIYSGTFLNRAEWHEACVPIAAEREEFSGEWTEMKIRALSSDAAVFEGSYWMTIKSKSGAHRHWPSIAQGGLVERTAEGWRLTLLGNDGDEYEDIGG